MYHVCVWSTESCIPFTWDPRNVRNAPQICDTAYPWYETPIVPYYDRVHSMPRMMGILIQCLHLPTGGVVGWPLDRSTPLADGWSVSLAGRIAVFVILCIATELRFDASHGIGVGQLLGRAEDSMYHTTTVHRGGKPGRSAIPE